MAFSTARAILLASKDTSEPSRLMMDKIFLDLLGRAGLKPVFLILA